LWRLEHVRRSDSAIKAQWRNVPHRTHYRCKNVERDAAFLKLVIGVLPLLKDGTRRHRHSIREACAILNDEEKYNEIGTTQGQRIIKANGFYSAIRRVGPGVTLRNNAQRRAFYDKMRRFTALRWEYVCFSDAHTLQPNHIPNPRNDRVVIRIGQIAPPLAKVRQTDRRVQPAVHCYGCITRYGLLGPYFVIGKLNSKTYKSEVLLKLLPDLEAKHRSDESFIFMQDGAGEHVSGFTQDYLRTTDITFWPKGIWPGNSPDLNPIEGFWSLLRATITPVGQYNLSNDVLMERATDWFKNVTVEQCRKACRGMVGRMQQLSAGKFWSIAH